MWRPLLIIPCVLLALRPSPPACDDKPLPTFYPLDAQRIVVISDCSSCMMQKFDVLRQDIRQFIQSLRPDQAFNLVFFGPGIPFMVGGNRLLPATPTNRQKADDFLSGFCPRGCTDPISALRRAFSLKPDVIFLLTDGDFPDNDAVLAEVRNLNAAKAVKVNTIAFMDHDESYEKLLKTIADENGGRFRFVSEEDLSH